MIPSANRGETLKIQVARPLKQLSIKVCVVTCEAHNLLSKLSSPVAFNVIEAE